MIGSKSFVDTLIKHFHTTKSGIQRQMNVKSEAKRVECNRHEMKRKSIDQEKVCSDKTNDKIKSGY
jgi:hypothetical protein